MRASLRPRAVAICHCHYPDLVDELSAYLGRLPSGCAIHVSSSDPEVFAAWGRAWRRDDGTISFHQVENRGRDVRPFFQVLRSVRASGRTPILKIHGKKSSYTARGTEWRHDLLSSLIPDRRTAVSVLDWFRRNRRIGLIGPHASFTSRAVYWGGNRDGVAAFLQAFGQPAPADEELGFFAGTMFWVRASVARRLATAVDLDAFATESGQQDGTYAHALERALPMAARALGYDLYEMTSTAPLTPADGRDREVVYI